MYRGPSRGSCVGTLYTHPSRVGVIQQLFSPSWYHSPRVSSLSSPPSPGAAAAAGATSSLLLPSPPLLLCCYYRAGRQLPCQRCRGRRSICHLGRRCELGVPCSRRRRRTGGRRRRTALPCSRGCRAAAPLSTCGRARGSSFLCARRRRAGARRRTALPYSRGRRAAAPLSACGRAPGSSAFLCAHRPTSARHPTCAAAAA